MNDVIPESTFKGWTRKPDELKYRATDELTVSVGADIFGGSEQSLYGFLKDNGTVFVEFRWGF